MASGPLDQMTDGAADGAGNADGAWAAEVYAELRRAAASLASGEREGRTLEPTALVHEAWLRLSSSRNAASLERAEFLGLAVQTMRRILIDGARARAAAKRGGGARRTTLSGVAGVQDRDEGLLVLDEALAALTREDAELARVVELRFVAGCTTEEIAELLGTSPRTVKRRWRFARAWLHRAMTEDAS
jgi:RNA polymerase sigma factor (TIGR02999 family)